jgi:hypothetical protein
MNCREEIREHLIAERMRRWLMIAKSMYPKCPRWRARRNFWYLCRKYPDLVAALVALRPQFSVGEIA